MARSPTLCLMIIDLNDYQLKPKSWTAAAKEKERNH